MADAKIVRRQDTSQFWCQDMMEDHSFKSKTVSVPAVIPELFHGWYTSHRNLRTPSDTCRSASPRSSERLCRTSLAFPGAGDADHCETLLVSAVVKEPIRSSSRPFITRQPMGLRATRQPLGGHKVAPLYFCHDIVETRRGRKGKLCTHLSEYLAEVVSKFDVDPI